MFLTTKISSESSRYIIENQFMKAVAIFVIFGVAISISACDFLRSSTDSETFEFSFKDEDHNFEAFYTGYNVGWKENMEFDTGYRYLPEPLDTTQKGHFIAATNRSDDVKMLFRKQVEGLEPNTEYSARFSVEFATNVPFGCAGIGGAPGEAVRVIASASSQKPEAFVEDDYYWLNLQYQNENPARWYNSRIMGDIANSVSCEEAEGSLTDYEIKEVSSETGHDTVVADDQGRTWLMFGTRSGFEGRTALFYTNFEATLSH